MLNPPAVIMATQTGNKFFKHFSLFHLFCDVESLKMSCRCSSCPVGCAFALNRMVASCAAVPIRWIQLLPHEEPSTRPPQSPTHTDEPAAGHRPQYCDYAEVPPASLFHLQQQQQPPSSFTPRAAELLVSVVVKLNWRP